MYDWKSYVPQKGTAGSTPALSASEWRFPPFSLINMGFIEENRYIRTKRTPAVSRSFPWFPDLFHLYFTFFSPNPEMAGGGTLADNGPEDEGNALTGRHLGTWGAWRRPLRAT